MAASDVSFSFADFDSLLDTISRWLDRPDLVSDIPDFVYLAESELQRDCHFRLSDATTTGTTVADQEYIDLPSDYVEARHFRFDEDQLPPLDVRSWTEVSHLKKFHSGGHTRAGVIHGDRIYVGPVPGAVAFTFFYKAGISHLSASNQSNFILTEYPDALFYGSLKHSAPFLGADERLAVWLSFYEPAKASAIQQEARSRTGFGPLAMRPDIGIP